MVDKLVQEIKAKFIDNFDEGLLLQGNFNTEFGELERAFLWLKEFLGIQWAYHYGVYEYDKYKMERLEENILIGYTSFWNYFKTPPVANRDIEKASVNRTDLMQYLIFPLCKAQLEHRHEDYFRVEPDFLQKFTSYWTPSSTVLKSILACAPEYLGYEKLNASDRVTINVGYRSFDTLRNGKIYDKFRVVNRGGNYDFIKESDCKGIKATYADIFIISNKLFVKLSLGAKGIIYRTENIISRDIKKISISQSNLLEIYFHGHYDPETIVLDDYNEALNLQRHLTELRDKRSGYEGKRV